LYLQKKDCERMKGNIFLWNKHQFNLVSKDQSSWFQHANRMFPVENERKYKPSQPVEVENCRAVHEVAKKIHALKPVQLRDYCPKFSMMHPLVQLRLRHSHRTAIEVT
jgi:hypothetical protein